MLCHPEVMEQSAMCGVVTHWAYGDVGRTVFSQGCATSYVFAWDHMFRANRLQYRSTWVLCHPEVMEQSVMCGVVTLGRVEAFRNTSDVVDNTVGVAGKNHMFRRRDTCSCP